VFGEEQGMGVPCCRFVGGSRVPEAGACTPAPIHHGGRGQLFTGSGSQPRQQAQVWHTWMVVETWTVDLKMATTVGWPPLSFLETLGFQGCLSPSRGTFSQ
jgi:hypothetical protein